MRLAGDLQLIPVASHRLPIDCVACSSASGSAVHSHPESIPIEAPPPPPPPARHALCCLFPRQRHRRLLCDGRRVIVPDAVRRGRPPKMRRADPARRHPRHVQLHGDCRAGRQQDRPVLGAGCPAGHGHVGVGQGRPLRRRAQLFRDWVGWRPRWLAAGRDEMDRLPGENYVIARSSFTYDKQLNTIHSLAMCVEAPASLAPLRASQH